MNTLPSRADSQLRARQSPGESAVKLNSSLRDLLFAAATLLLAASLCIYGFVKIVPLALAHTGAPTVEDAPQPDAR